ncbi:Imm7 family immunity protein [Hymenobacter cellulosilyticus]|uniref:Immunity 7 family protein n=1 Tax=Hymenobacter cellulosilyticus TaxID=2932248 RepID=A0A8T9PYE2_9BACT|nr:Imm7 family immunity protein [Hymenobacter cellulosilyticus]UOQ70436.1 immunity 7 family protein [Hymenobacter cellulosilyticus]
MVEIHGWITLRYSDYHSEEAPQREFVARFKQYLEQTGIWPGFAHLCQLTVYNGQYCFTITAQHNHPGQPFYPLEIFTWIAQESTGSYGLLHFHDDEDPALHNEFQVYVLKRGKLIKAADSFLSPYFEEVEREYDAANPPLD